MYERTESKVERWIPGRGAKNESNRSDRQDKMRSQVKNEPRGPLLKENIEGEKENTMERWISGGAAKKEVNRGRCNEEE